MINYKDKKISGDACFYVKYPIEEAFQIEELIVILYKPASYDGWGQFFNLVCFDLKGQEFWKAELAPGGIGSYVKIISNDPLIVDSFSSYRCEIDIGTGRIKKTKFYK